MRYFSLLVLLTILTLTSKSVELPIYLKSDYEPEKFMEWDMARYIRSSTGPKLVEPYHTKEEYKKDLGPLKTILTESGVLLQQITNDNTAQTETWMGVNPTNPKNIIATANDFSATGGGQYRMVAHASNDGGESWTRTVTDNHNEDFIFRVSGGQNATIFDPIITFNDEGTALYLYGYATTSGSPQPNGIFTSISDDGGFSWNQWNSTEEVPWVIFSTNGLQDRYHTAVDNTGGQYNGRFYAAWKDFGPYNGIRVGYADKGNYVSQLWYNTEVYNQSGTQAPFPIVGVDGTVWLSFRRSSSTDQTDAPIYMSTNGGNSFVSHSTAMNNWNIGLPSSELEEGSGRVVLDKKDNMRMSTNPQLAVDHSDSPYRGSLYCIMPGKEGGLDGPNKIYLGILRDAKPTTAADEWDVITIDDSPNGNDMFFPAITVDPITGYIHVFYYTSQYDPDNIKVDAQYAYSYDGGQTWNHKRLTNESMTVRATNQSGIGNRYWGDYACITAHDNHVYPLFWVQENPFTFGSNELYTAKLRTYPDKPENVSIETASNSNVTISWSGIFDGLGEPIDNYDVKVFKTTEESGQIEVGTFEKGINSWTDEETENGQEITYGLQVISKDVRGEGEIHNYTVNIGGRIKTLPPTNFVAKGTADGLILNFVAPSLSIDNQPIESIDKVNLYSNGNLLGSAGLGNIASGVESNLFIELPNDVYYDDLYITAVRSRDGEEEESDASNSSIGYSGEPISQLSESFEDATDRIPYFTDAGWDISSEISSDGDFSFTDSPGVNYDFQADNFVIFKPIIVNQTNPKIVFDLIANVRDGDVANFLTSNDFGKTWKNQLSTNSTFFDGWTEDLSTSEWLTVSMEHLAEGQDSDTLYLKMELKSNIINASDGIFVDNLRIDNITSVEIDNTIGNLSIYPNPAVDNFTVNFNLPKSDYVTPKIYDLQGNLVLAGDMRFSNSGENTIKMDLGNMPNGVYYLQLENSSANIFQAFSVSK